MSRAVVTLATSSSKVGSGAIDFYPVKNYFDSAETGSGIKAIPTGSYVARAKPQKIWVGRSI